MESKDIIADRDRAMAEAEAARQSALEWGDLLLREHMPHLADASDAARAAARAAHQAAAVRLRYLVRVALDELVDDSGGYHLVSVDYRETVADVDSLSGVMEGDPYFLGSSGWLDAAWDRAGTIVRDAMRAVGVDDSDVGGMHGVDDLTQEIVDLDTSDPMAHACAHTNAVVCEAHVEIPGEEPDEPAVVVGVLDMESVLDAHRECAESTHIPVVEAVLYRHNEAGVDVVVPVSWLSENRKRGVYEDHRACIGNGRSGFRWAVDGEHPGEVETMIESDAWRLLDRIYEPDTSVAVG